MHTSVEMEEGRFSLDTGTTREGLKLSFGEFFEYAPGSPVFKIALDSIANTPLTF